MSQVIRIPNIEEYILEIINNELILTPKKKYITEDELNKISLTHSKIIFFKVHKEEEIISSGRKSFRSVLVDIWKSLPTQKILMNTTFNFKLLNENGEKGYYWCDDIQMSFQNKDVNGTFKEILHMTKVNNLTIKLSIKLETDRIINFNYPNSET